MEIQFENETFPDDWTEIINFLKAHSEFSFSSARLSKVFGVSSFRISKILFKLNKMGYLEKRTRGKNNRIKCFYKWKSPYYKLDRKSRFSMNNFSYLSKKKPENNE